MSIQQLLITEVSQQPEPLLREVWHYLNFLKAKATDERHVKKGQENIFAFAS